MSPGWTIRPAEPGDAGALADLYLRAFGRPLPPGQWAWKLARRGPAANVWLAEAGGRPIFQYAGIPTRFRHLGEERWAMVSVDTMTDPAYRRRGLLTEVGAATYAHWRAAGVAFVVGLPNAQWGSRTGALGWRPVGELRWWVRWLDPVRALAARAGLAWPVRSRPAARPRAGGVRVAPLEDPGPLDDLWRRLPEEGVVRDAAWLRWRYLEAVPRWQALGAWAGGALRGAAALRLKSEDPSATGLIGEARAEDLPALRALLAEACAALRAGGAARAALLASRGGPLEEAALAAGFLPRRAAFPVQAVDLGGGLPAALHQGGDFDVV